MSTFLNFLREYGHTAVFAMVLMENLGLPLPSLPLLLVAGALAGAGELSFFRLLSLSIVAALTADIVWFYVGRFRGRPILSLLCRMSLNVDSCVAQTENVFIRYGLPSLLIAKFVPGLNAVAPPMAGLLRMSLLRFLIFDFGGVAFWAVVGVGGGYVFRHQIEFLLDRLAALGRFSLALLILLIAAYMIFKFVERRRFLARLRAVRINVRELKERLEHDENILVIDVRQPLAFASDELKIKGAVRIAPDDIQASIQGLPHDREIVMYCT